MHPSTTTEFPFHGPAAAKSPASSPPPSASAGQQPQKTPSTTTTTNTTATAGGKCTSRGRRGCLKIGMPGSGRVPTTLCDRPILRIIMFLCTLHAAFPLLPTACPPLHCPPRHLLLLVRSVMSFATRPVWECFAGQPSIRMALLGAPASSPGIRSA